MKYKLATIYSMGYTLWDNLKDQRKKIEIEVEGNQLYFFCVL